MRRLLLLSALATAAAASDDARIGTHTLALLQKEDIRASHSQFFAALEGRGHNVTYKLASDSSVIVKRYGDWLYDNLVIFAPKAESFGALTAADVLSFLNGGGNLFVAAGPGVSDSVRAVAEGCGVDLDPPSYRVMDHFQYDAGDAEGTGLHTRIITTEVTRLPSVVGAELSASPASRPLLWEGSGMSLNPDSILALPLLTAAPTAYSADPAVPVKGYPAAAGKEVVLVAAVQARNNARAVFTGSLWALSDAAANAPVQQAATSSDSHDSSGGSKGAASSAGRLSATRSGNGVLAAAVAAWAFQQSGVLRIAGVAHTRVDGSAPEQQVVADPQRPDLPKSMFPAPEIARYSQVYRIRDDVVYRADVEAWHADTQQWLPHDIPSGNALQLEFVMLDPYVRVSMCSLANGTYLAHFRVPDVYGIYHFRLHYRRWGWTVLHRTDQVNVRPYRHNEYERFITSAYPYYTAAFVSMAAVFVFSLLFLLAGQSQSQPKPKAQSTTAAATGAR